MALQITYSQPLDGDLTAISALTGTNNIYYRSGTDTWQSVGISTGIGFTAGLLAIDASASISWLAPVSWTATSLGVSGPGQVLDTVKIGASTATLIGTTTTNTAKGYNRFSIYSPTYTGTGPVTVDQGATLYIESAPLATGGVTLTNAYALWIDGGTVRFDGGLTVGGTAAPSTGVINASIGYTIAGAATSGNVLRGDGTNFVSSALNQSDLTITGDRQSPTVGVTIADGYSFDIARRYAVTGSLKLTVQGNGVFMVT